LEKQTELRVLKFLSTYHYKFFQIMFALLIMMATKGIVIPDMNGSRTAAITLLVGNTVAGVLFQFIIIARHNRIEQRLRIGKPVYH
jgi:hypothetical protein